jgi:flagellin
MSTPLAINTNVGSLNAQRNLVKAGRNLGNSIERLSSGLRINSASDDAAGKAIAEGLRAQNNGYKQAVENANDAVSILSTAEGAYNAISDVLIRMRELAVQSANDSLTTVERGYVNTEFTQLATEITRISDVTEFNGIKLLDATAGAANDGALVFQVGTRSTANDRINISLGDQDATALGINASAVDTLANAQTAITTLDAAISTLATSRATLGATVNQLTAAVDNLGVTVENMAAAASQITDTDVAAESANFTKNQVIMQAGVSMLSQANSMPSLALRLLG